MDEAEQLAAAAAAAAAKEAADAAAAKPAKDAADAAAGNQGENAEIVALRAQLAQAQAAAAQFEGLDPAAAKAAIAARTEAEAARAKAERETAEAQGNWERVRELMNAERDAKEAALQAQIAELQGQSTSFQERLNQQTVERQFGDSKFIAQKVALPVAKVRTLFKDHVETKDGVAVVFDKPKGEANRTMIVDAQGKPAAFDVAIAKVIEADPDKDTLLKSDVKPGAASRSDGRKTEDTVKTRHQVFADGFAALRANKR